MDLRTLQRKVIGGEFELDCIPTISRDGIRRLTQNNSGTWTTSGRVAYYLILRYLKSVGVNHVHLPAFLCESLLLPVKSLKMDYSFYPVMPDLTAMPDPPVGSAVLLIHYFGWINPATDYLRKEAVRDYHLIEDAAHVFLNNNYFSHSQIRYSFFTPRKHAPTILGGWCNLDFELDIPSKNVELCTCKSLIARLTKANYLRESDEGIDQTIEDFYIRQFHEVEMFLDSNIYPTRLPKLILDVIDSMDWAEISMNRRENWQLLDDLIKNKVERFTKDLNDDIVPLGYVIKHKNRDRLREKLAEHRIFAPIHWPLSKEINKNRFPVSVELANSLLTVPIDQRYSQDDISYIAGILKSVC